MNLYLGEWKDDLIYLGEWKDDYICGKRMNVFKPKL